MASGFVNFERENNRFLQAIENNAAVRAIVEKADPEGQTLLVPMDSALDDVSVSPEFAKAHIIMFDNTNQLCFATLSGLQGTFSESLDDIYIFKDKSDTRLEHATKLKILRQADYTVKILNRKYNIFVTSDVILKAQFRRTRDQEASSPAPTTTNPTFEDFARKMREEPTLIASIKNFIEAIHVSNYTPEELKTKVTEFIQATNAEIKVSRTWKGSTPLEISNAAEGLEKYVMTKVYSKTFSPAISDVEIDIRLSTKLAAFQFVSHVEMDLPDAVIRTQSFNEAMQELRKMNLFKAPRDKLVCVTNCSSRLFIALEEAAKMEGKVEAKGADDFVPLLIYCVLKSNPNNLHSNLQFIEDYRNPQVLDSEAGYYLTSLKSAVYFWENAKAEDIKVDPSKYDEITRSIDEKLKCDVSLPKATEEVRESISDSTFTLRADSADAHAGSNFPLPEAPDASPIEVPLPASANIVVQAAVAAAHHTTDVGECTVGLTSNQSVSSEAGVRVASLPAHDDNEERYRRQKERVYSCTLKHFHCTQGEVASPIEDVDGLTLRELRSVVERYNKLLLFESALKESLDGP